MNEFVEFPKIARLSREVVVTEKIDGTNAQVCIGDDGTVRAGSRNRWITPEDDNFGFAAWVRDHADELAALGPGRHFGEWWGSGIQRGYGLPKGEKRFSLFNTGRWVQDGGDRPPLADGQRYAPLCCHVVPVLWRGEFDTTVIHGLLAELREFGSDAAPGFMKPEGLIVYHVAGNLYFKKTIEKDEEPKSMRAAA